MPYEGLGARHTVEAFAKPARHGQIVVEDGFVGSAFKVEQVDRFVRPVDAQDIAVGEMAELQLGGIHEAPAEGALAAAGVGDPVWIAADNTLLAAFAAGALPVGLITEVDGTRDPEVLRINSNVAHLLATYA